MSERRPLAVLELDVVWEAIDLAGRSVTEQRCLSDTIGTNNTAAMIPLELQIRRLRNLFSCHPCTGG